MTSLDFRSCETCPQCSAEDQSSVINSRIHKAGRLRRRKCFLCGERWSTIEISVKDYSALHRVSGFLVEVEGRVSVARDVLHMPYIGSLEEDEAS